MWSSFSIIKQRDRPKSLLGRPLEMTGCFNSAYSAIIQEKWMLFAYFYYVQSSFIKLDSLFLGFLFLIVIAVKELFPVVFRFGASFFNVATFRTASFSFF